MGDRQAILISSRICTRRASVKFLWQEFFFYRQRAQESRVAAGWLNVLGQFASTAGSGYLTAVHLGEMIQLSSGHVMTKQDDFLVYASEPWQPKLKFHDCC